MWCSNKIVTNKIVMNIIRNCKNWIQLKFNLNLCYSATILLFHYILTCVACSFFLCSLNIHCSGFLKLEKKPNSSAHRRYIYIFFCKKGAFRNDSTKNSNANEIVDSEHGFILVTDSFLSIPARLTISKLLVYSTYINRFFLN